MVYVFQKCKVSFTRAILNAVIAHFTIGFCDGSQNCLRKPVLKLYFLTFVTLSRTIFVEKWFCNILTSLTNKEFITNNKYFLQCCFSCLPLSLESLIYLLRVVARIAD